nr:prepilin-type N-terminal cleavage/methylation domain-containing protein [Yersinia frederiksenii]
MTLLEVLVALVVLALAAWLLSKVRVNKSEI